MCNLNHKLMIAMLAVSLMSVSANAEDAKLSGSLSTGDAEPSTLTKVEPMLTSANEVGKEEESDERPDPKPPIIVFDGTPKSDVLKKTVDSEESLSDVESSQTLLSTANEEQPDRSWQEILGGEMHSFSMAMSGWVIFNLAAELSDSPVEIYIYNERWNELAAFDSTGCGAELFLEPQIVTIVILNPSKERNAYKLNIFQ